MYIRALFASYIDSCGTVCHTISCLRPFYLPLHICLFNYQLEVMKVIPTRSINSRFDSHTHKDSCPELRGL